MDITLQAAQNILREFPIIGDIVTAISNDEIVYTNKHKISLPVIQFNNIKEGDIVTSVRTTLSITNKEVEINVDHYDGGKYAEATRSLIAKIRDIKLDHVISK
jgi:hypothetical protein